MLNFGLLKNPLNWFTIGLMLLLAAIGGHLILSWVGVNPATESTSS